MYISQCYGFELNRNEWENLYNIYDRYCLHWLYEQGRSWADVREAIREAILYAFQEEEFGDLSADYVFDDLGFVCFDEWLENDFLEYDEKTIKDFAFKNERLSKQILNIQKRFIRAKEEKEY